MNCYSCPLSPSTADEREESATRAKESGNEAYRRRDFTSAIHYYKRAVGLNPKEMNHFSNLAAAYLECGQYEESIEACTQAIKAGRSFKADYKRMAKIYARLGKARKRQGALTHARSAYQDALIQYRIPEYQMALNEVEIEIKKKEEEAYIDPEKAEQERSQGNLLFSSGDFTSALKHYSEAIRRSPHDSRLYSNRAACYTKLMSFDLAIKDCEKSIELDSSFVKAYLRMANALRGMGKITQAMAIYEKAIEIDSNCDEAIEGYKNCSIQNIPDPEEIKRQAMNDPEIQQILKDPSIRLILQQMQTDPSSAREYLKNPIISSKFMKLREAGLITISYK
ncbi:stress-induced-phosphoprotein 1 [Lepeophtheirus salmonis]|nr:stress-induced-phosphoprotein 1-like [Lepeophtheirus salmonis]